MTEHHFPKTLPDGALDRAAGEALPDIPFDPVPRLRQALDIGLDLLRDGSPGRAHA